MFRVKEKFSNLTTGYTLEEAQAIVSELKSIEELLRAGQKEKTELIQSLTMLGEDFAAIDAEVLSSVAVETCVEKSSTASQTDFYGEVIF